MSICIHITDVYRDLNLRHQVVWEPTTKQDLKRECWRRVGLIVIEHLDEWGKWRELVKSEDTDAVQKVVKKCIRSVIAGQVHQVRSLLMDGWADSEPQPENMIDLLTCEVTVMQAYLEAVNHYRIHGRYWVPVPHWA